MPIELAHYLTMGIFILGTAFGIREFWGEPLDWRLVVLVGIPAALLVWFGSMPVWRWVYLRMGWEVPTGDVFDSFLPLFVA